MPSLNLLDPVLAKWPTFACLLGLLILIRIIASASFKGWLGEHRVRRGLRRLPEDQYHPFHDLYLPHPGAEGTTQIDHVIVSRFGIFVIETKNYRGWIFGSSNQRQWTQQIHRRKSRFQNPLHQNHLHVRALMEFLGLTEERFKPVVCFVGDTEFKTPMPGNVIHRGLTGWITRHTLPLLEPGEVDHACSALWVLDQSTDRRSAARKHAKAVRNRVSE